MKRKFKTLVIWRSCGDFFWHLRAPNGNILCDGGEGYKRRAAMVRAISLVLFGVHDEPLEAQITAYRKDIQIRESNCKP